MSPSYEELEARVEELEQEMKQKVGIFQVMLFFVIASLVAVFVSRVF